MTKIVVGVDASEGARRALQWAVDEAKLRDTTVEAMHVWQLPVFAATPFGEMPLNTGHFEADALRQFNELIDALETRTPGVKIERTFVTGHPANQLLEAAKDADLLVVGTRGRGGFTGLLLGSTSQQVSHHAPCPVVIVPGDER